MEALHVRHLQEDEVMGEEEEVEWGKCGEQEEAATEASYPTGSITDDEETDEEGDSEPEPPQVIRRKVSFADAFGLNLVSVKEFDNVEVTEVSTSPDGEVSHPSEEYYMSRLFTVPSSPEELDQRLEAQLVELESIELLPGTTTLRGIIRVVNLCYSKSVLARMTLDRWTNYFDLMAEYVPGSSDRKTDRFTFKYTLVPPFDREGTRLEFCLCYQTPTGTFWANNKGMNYVLFLHQRGGTAESSSSSGKRSCLKANRRGRAQEKTWEDSDTSAGAEEERAETQSLVQHGENNFLVDDIKSRRRATRLARAQDHLSPRRQHVLKAYPHDLVMGQNVSQPLPTPWGDAANFLHKHHKKQPDKSLPVLTYHQIPLLRLDWNNDKPHQLGVADTDDIWMGRSKMTLSASAENREDKPDMWETFHNGTDDPDDKAAPVCDVWQAFLNGPSRADHSAVPESEWLQTAALVSPSNDKEPKTQKTASSQVQGFQVGMSTPTAFHAHASAACQPLSDTRGTSWANVALNAADLQPAEACVSGLRYDNAATRDASQRSQTNSVTDTRQEFRLEGATPVSEGSVDDSAECHKRATWERERGGIIGGEEGIGRDEPFTADTDDLVTSSGESETTEMTATPQSPNASGSDRISQGAGLDGGLSSSGEGAATGTAHNAMGDTLAFRGTIRPGTKDGDGERFVSSTSRQRVEEGIMSTCAEKTDEEIFRPEKTEECEISQRYADEKQRKEFRLNQNSGNPLRENESDKNEIRPVQSNADESNPKPTCEDNFNESQITAGKFKLDGSENGDVALNNKDSEEFEKTEAEPLDFTTSRETKGLIGAEAEVIQVLNEGAWQRNGRALKLEQGENTLAISQVLDKQSMQIRAEEEETLTHIQEDVALELETSELDSDKTWEEEEEEERKSLSCDGRTEEQQETNTSPWRQQTDVQNDQGTFRLLPTNPVDVVETRWTHSHDDVKGHEEDVGGRISAEEVTVKENIVKKDNRAVLQHRPETLERTEEDVSQRDGDESVSIGKTEIEAPGELMGNAEDPRGERESAAAELEEQEASAAEVESPPLVGFRKTSEGTKGPITTESAAPLDVIEPGSLAERFGEDLVRRVWEEVFGGNTWASNRDINVFDGIDIGQNCHSLALDDAFDSGVFSLTESPTDPNPSLSQSLQTARVCESNEERSQSGITEQKTPIVSESQEDLNSGACPGRALSLISDSTSTESAQSSPKDEEGRHAGIKERSVGRRETGRQMEDGVVAHEESANRSGHPSHQHVSSVSEKLVELESVAWWSLLYILSHITRLLLCVILVAGFFLVVFLYDFKLFLVFHTFSLCCWFCKWKRHRMEVNKVMAE